MPIRPLKPVFRQRRQPLLGQPQVLQLGLLDLSLLQRSVDVEELRLTPALGQRLRSQVADGRLGEGLAVEAEARPTRLLRIAAGLYQELVDGADASS